MTHKTDITYCGIPLTVTYDFYPAQKETRIDPPYPATVDAYEICKWNAAVCDVCLEIGRAHV